MFNKNNNTNNANNENAKREYMKVMSIDITGVKDYDKGCRFNLRINGVMIYGCWLRMSKDGNIFISFPQQQGSNGKYYDIVYCPLSPDDQGLIIAEVERIAQNS